MVKTICEYDPASADCGRKGKKRLGKWHLYSTTNEHTLLNGTATDYRLRSNKKDSETPPNRRLRYAQPDQIVKRIRMHTMHLKRDVILYILQEKAK